MDDQRIAPRAALVILALLLAACDSTPTAPAPPVTRSRNGPDLVVVLAAGLRADAPGTLGAEAALFSGVGRTPSHRFAAAYSQSPVPFVSLGSLLTGLYAGAVPLCAFPRRVDQVEDTSDPPWCARIPEARYTLPEVLGLYGYHTALITTSFPGASAFGAEFQQYSELQRADDLTAAALASWGDVGPRLLVVVTTDLRLGERRDLNDAMGRLGDLHDPTPPPPEVTRKANAVYSEVAKDLGHRVGDLLDALEAASGDRGLMAVVGGLNGLNIAEQGGTRDGAVRPLTEDLVLDRTVHVPLALFESGATTTTIHDDPVQLLDVFPTLAAVAGVRPPADLAGSDLRAAPLALGAGHGYAELGDMLALRQGSSFLIFRCLVHYCTSLDPEVTRRLEDEPADLSGYGAYSLYDVVWDPWQEHPIFDARRMRPLRTLLLHIRQGPAAIPEDALDAQQLWSIRMVRSHGYW